jgi:hypothetical protein
MAHHVAELLVAIDAAPNGKLRKEREREAVQVITKLWLHRSTYENRINPLFDLKPVIQVIRTLAPSLNSWVRRSDGTRQVYDAFRRLMIGLLLRHVESIDHVAPAISSAKKTAQYQSRDEREILSGVGVWIEDAGKSAKRQKSRRAPETSAEKIDIEATINALIAEARSALDAVSTEIAQQNKAGPTNRQSSSI